MFGTSVEEARVVARAGYGVRLPPILITPQEAKILLEAVEKERNKNADSLTMNRIFEKTRILHAYAETKAACHGGCDTVMRLE